MKPTTTRERVLLVIAPAVLVIAVYAWLLFPRKALEQAEKALETARRAEPSLTEFREREYRLAQLDEQLTVARNEMGVTRLPLSPEHCGARGYGECRVEK